MPYYVTLEDFKNKIDSINDDNFPLINSNTEMNLSSLGAGYTSLQKMRQFAYERLNTLFDFLGYKAYSPEAIQDLNNKIQEFHNTTASFNGIRLRNEIINPLKGVVVDKMQVEL